MLSSTLVRSMSKSLSSSTARPAAWRRAHPRLSTPASSCRSTLGAAVNMTPRVAFTTANNSHMAVTSKENGWNQPLFVPAVLFGATLLGGTALFDVNRDDSLDTSSPFSSKTSLCEAYKRQTKINEYNDDCEMNEKVDLSNAEGHVQMSETEYHNACQLGDGYIDLGEALRLDGDFEEGLKMFRKAKDVYRRLVLCGDPADKASAKCLHSLCHYLIGKCALEDSGDVKAAMREFEKSKALLRHSRKLAPFCCLVGATLRKHGFLTEAVEEYREIAAMPVAADEPEFIVFVTGCCIGWILSEQGDSESALSEYQNAVDLLRRQQNEVENQLDTGIAIALCHMFTGFELNKMGDTKGAVHHFQKAIDIFRCDSSDTSFPFDFYSRSGRLLFAEGKLKEAAEMYVSAVEFFQGKTPDPIIIAIFRYNIACTMFAQDDLEGAERELRKALAIKEIGTKGDPVTAHDEPFTWEDLGLASEQLGKSIERARESKKATIIGASNESSPLPLGGDLRDFLQEIFEIPLFRLLRLAAVLSRTDSSVATIKRLLEDSDLD